MMRTESNTFDKWKTYFITFMAYAALHCMRMTYSTIKTDFQKKFEQSDLFLGVLDATAYVSLGLGFFFRFLIQGDRSIIHTYVVTILIASFGYLIIPTSSLIIGDDINNQPFFKYVFPAFGLLLFGYFQFGAWPTLLSLTNSRFNLKREGKAIGIWSATGDFGDVIGFGVTGLLVNNLGYQWEITMIAGAAFNVIMAIVVVLFVTTRAKSVRLQGTQAKLISDEIKENEKTKKNQQGEKEPGEKESGEKETGEKESGEVGQVQEVKSKFRKFLQYSREFIKTRPNQLYLMAFGLLKCILYGFLLWMPTYLSNVGFKQYKSTIPIAFSLGTLVGSFILGHFYEQSGEQKSGILATIKAHFRKFSLFYCCILLSATFTIFYYIDPEVVAYFILSGISGALLGGCFNMFSSNEVIALTGGRPEELEMLATLSMAVGNIVVGVLELFIGITLNVKGDAEASKKLFLILIGVGLATVALLLWRGRIIKGRRESVRSEMRLSFDKE